jgi:hypothetical protein
MATTIDQDGSHLGSPRSLTVYYKYVKEMPIYSKPASAFVQSIVEKYSEYARLKLELHVSPFYGWRDAFVWQPVFDFDTPASVEVARHFCRSELSGVSGYFVEITGVSVHIVSRDAYGPLKKDQIAELREYLRETFAEYQHLDIVSSVRHLPIRRAPSIDTLHRFIIRPIRITEFLSTSYESLIKELQASVPSQLQFGYIVATYTLPRALLPLREAPWGVGRKFTTHLTSNKT